MSQHLTTAIVAQEMSRRGYSVAAGPAVDVTGGAADSRIVQPGDLFCAFPGEETDGNLFVADALRAGAVAAICSRPPKASGPPRPSWLSLTPPVPSERSPTPGARSATPMSSASPAPLARRPPRNDRRNARRPLPHPPAARATSTPARAFRSHSSARRDHEVSVLEMAMDSPGEIGDLCRIAEPQIGAV